MTEPKQGGKTLWLGAIAAGAIVAAGSAAWLGGQWPLAEVSVTRAPEQAPAGSEPAQTSEVAAAKPDAPVAAPAISTVPPILDLVRLEPDGSALVAGRAEPGAEVQIIVDGSRVATATADASGNFVAFIEVSETGQPLVMWLSTKADGGAETLSEQQVILSPASELIASAASGDPSAAPLDSAATNLVPDPTGGTPQTVADPQPMAETASSAGSSTNAPPPSGNTELAVMGAADPVATQPGTVLVSDDSGVGLMRPAPLADADEIRIDTIAYGASDLIELRGRSGSGGQIRLSLDGEPVAVTHTDNQGGWQADLRSVPAGTYTLRAERIDEQGSVVASASVPFRREAPEQVARAAAREGLAQVVTVQPGFTLWGIARDRYGSGIRYVQVFEANKTQIGDPDLIYPGQVFDLPSALGAD
jgi:nucleoid-associated protein YgaU